MPVETRFRTATPTAATGAGGQLASLIKLAAKMQAIRRDSSIEEKIKRQQLQQLKEQADPIKENIEQKEDTRKRSSLVVSSSEAAAAIQEAASPGKPGATTTTEATHTDEAKQPRAEDRVQVPTESQAVESVADGKTLGTWVDTFA